MSNISDNDKKRIIENTITTVLEKFFRVSYNDINHVLQGGAILNILSRTQSKYVDVYKKPITEEILWMITGDPYAPYYNDLYNNIFNNSFVAQVNEIVDDYYNNFYFKSSNVNNITIINKNFQNLHRSGWQYIVDNIVNELNENMNVTNPLIIDTYIDKTFHWNKEFYRNKQVIPYKKNWVGFIHHTYSDYDSFNCIQLFNDGLFIESLNSCKCLIIMTEHLTKQVKKSLSNLNITHIEVITIIHPTENTDINFNWELFMNNKGKSVVQIGNWLRDVFGIYKVTLPKMSIISEKAILKNKNSDNYFPPENLLNSLYDICEPSKKKHNLDICRNSFTNMHMKGLYNCIADMEKSVKVISYLDNINYDKLLSMNIVFLNLVDASACNTLIECITRNTPIIINPIPAVMELLGPDYPLYYNDYYEVSKILDNTERIKEAHIYLSNLDKNTYTISAFIDKLKSAITKYV